MALPKVSQPKTNVTLPSGKKIRIRPFVGSEEKALLMAKQSTVKSDRISAAIDVLSSCSEMNVSELTLSDFEFLFMKSYEISVSQKINVTLHCQNKECGQPMSVSIPLEKIEVPKVDGKPEKIEVGKDEKGKTVRIFLKHPTVGESLSSSEGGDEADVRMIYACLEGVYLEDELCEIESFEEFSEWFMNQRDLYRLCTQFLNSIPRVEFKREWECPHCQNKNHTLMKGFDSFFS